MDIAYIKRGDYYCPGALTPAHRGYRPLRTNAEEVSQAASAGHLSADADGEHPDAVPYRHLLSDQ